MCVGGGGEVRDGGGEDQRGGARCTVGMSLCAQAVRDDADLNCMAVPHKYRHMNTFYKVGYCPNSLQ